jgi:hypothetical protein
MTIAGMMNSKATIMLNSQRGTDGSPFLSVRKGS